MSKHNLKIIIDQMQNSPTVKMIREMQDSPTMKMMREMQDSPAMKMMREMQDSPAMKMIREMQDSPAMKMMREMQLFTIDSCRLYSEVVEESINISNEIIDTSHSHQTQHLNDQSLFINTFFLSIYILVAHAQVPLDQLLVTLAQNFLNSALFFYFQSKYEVAKSSPNSINKNDFKNSRITTESVSLHSNPKINSELIEILEPYKFLEIIYEPDLNKSWLKVRAEINGEILEGYILRRYTSPIK
ncbi:MAG: hypothetical protein I8H74_01335 [Moraxellaceae bacterium]|nr:hypothetical protein [Moraxellaceae bacterium]